jgi:signal transduction histidine kinase
LDEKGNIRYWYVMKFLVHRRRGTVQLGGVALDITARKETEEALRLREGELQKSHEVLQALGGQLITAQEEERRRISRELHDDMNQRLAVLALNIQSAQKGFGEATPTYHILQQFYDGVSSLSDDVRRLAYQLHPSILDDLGLEVALQAFISDFSKWEGIPVAYVATDVPVVAQRIAFCLYRVTQECLRNVKRHAKATQVDVKLIGKNNGLTLSITDNGKGFSVEKMLAGKHGLGMVGMQERVRVVQGTYNLKSAPGHGTEITVWVPTKEV